jgi:hypothetical protein
MQAGLSAGYDPALSLILPHAASAPERDRETSIGVSAHHGVIVRAELLQWRPLENSAVQVRHECIELLGRQKEDRRRIAVTTAFESTISGRAGDSVRALHVARSRDPKLGFVIRFGRS